VVSEPLYSAQSGRRTSSLEEAQLPPPAILPNAWQAATCNIEDRERWGTALARESNCLFSKVQVDCPVFTE